jgi:lysophospholipase L1-like esterase
MHSDKLHIVLMGDSIFDNRTYTGGGPAVIDQVSDLLAGSGRATLLAVDGHCVTDLGEQLPRLPDDATHIVVSAGGNDALLNDGVLSERVGSVAEAALRIGDIADQFETQYRDAVREIVKVNAAVTVCTIYNGAFDDPAWQRAVTATLRVFNEAIFRVANELGLRVIDLRDVCNQGEDYANPIEPSSTGGLKIARAIVDVVTGN